MLTATIGAIALLGAAHPQGGDVSFLGRAHHDGRLLATPSPLPANGVYSVRGFGYNHREWVSRGITREYVPSIDWGGPGPAHYGAHEDDFARVYVRRGSAMVVVSPWVSLGDTGHQDLERARVQWLKEYGFVGGVRSFHNDRARGASGAGAMAAPQRSGELRPGIDFNPRATIRVPEGWRRETPRFQVVRPVEETRPVAQAPAGPDGL